jgi:hypothetical protein
MFSTEVGNYGYNSGDIVTIGSDRHYITQSYFHNIKIIDVALDKLFQKLNLDSTMLSGLEF